MAVADQLTSQKLEENPVLPLDTQANLVYVLVRIFRVIAQIVNPLVAWAASWANVRVTNAPTNTGLTVSGPDPKGSAYFNANKKGEGTECGLVGSKEGKNRWFVNVGNQSAESGSNAGSDFGIFRFNDAGVQLGNPMAIWRGSGLVQFTEPTAGVQIMGTNGLAVTNGSISAGKNLSAASGMGMYFDGNIANYLYMGSSNPSAWSWQWNRSNGQLYWLNDLGSALFGINGSGGVTTKGDFTAGANIYSSASIFIPMGGALYASPANGIQYGSGGFQYDGAGYQCMGIYGNPNWGLIYHRAYHQPGVWAGHFYYVAGMTWQMHNNGHFISNGIDLGSDARTKTKAQPIKDAASLFADCHAFEYERIEAKEIDGTPVVEVGLMAQDIQRVMPRAVRQDSATKADPEPLRRIDLGAMNALAAQAIGELLARVKTLDARIAALETKGTP